MYYYATLAAGRRRIYLSMHLPVYQGVIQQVSINDSVKPARERAFSQSVSQRVHSTVKCPSYGLLAA